MSPDRDGMWKEILHDFFREFLAFFFPRIHADLDWRTKPEFLDKELEKILPESGSGRRLADKLVKVRLQDGRETWILIHIEVQDRPDRTFARRMYTYNYRIFDRYQREVVSLAVLTGKQAWDPGNYSFQRWGCVLDFRFPTIALRSLQPRMAELMAHPNPFALITLAHLRSQDAGTERERYRWKLHFIRILYHRRYPRQVIMGLLRFIDWMIALPPELERRLEARAARLDQEATMPYVTSWERMGLERGLALGHREGLRLGKEEGLQEGRQEGRQEGLQKGERAGIEKGLREAIETAIGLRFGPKGNRLLPGIRKIRKLADLRKLYKLILKADSPDQIVAFLKSIGESRRNRKQA